MLFVEIRVEGLLEEHWSGWFADLAIVPAAAETRLAGLVPDQAALYGLVARLRDLTLPLRGVESWALAEPAGVGGRWAWGAGCLASPAGAHWAGLAEGGRADFCFGLWLGAGAAPAAGRLRFVCPAAGVDFSSTVIEHVEPAGAALRCRGLGDLQGQTPARFWLAAAAGTAATARWRLRLAAAPGRPPLYDNEPDRPEDAEPVTRLTAGRIAVLG